MSEYKYRNRDVAYPNHTLVSWPGYGSPTTYTYSSNSAQKVRTRGNPWRGDRRGMRNVGGSFWSKKIEVDLNPLIYSVVGTNGSYHPTLDGAFICETNTSLWRPSSSSWYAPTWTDADYWGATAISRCAPTSSTAELGVALGELHGDGLPKSALLTARNSGHSMSKKVADEYLGINFGVLPMVSDVEDTIKAVRNSGRILQQYARDSGRLVRRTYRFPSEIQTIVNDRGSVYPLNIPAWAAQKSFRGLETIVITKDRWFSGAFTYNPIVRDGSFGSEMVAKAREMNKLFGLAPTPYVGWNLLPWSWLVDWKTNVGDVLHNVSMALTDGLVMVYGYVMCQTTTVRTLSMTGGKLVGIPSGLVDIHPVTITTTEKLRRAANPFGFGIAPTSLSGRQWSILAALGLSKGSAHSLRNETD